MPLWTPYLNNDEALDLRKPALKTEPESPPPELRSPGPQHSPDYASVREAFSTAASPQQMPFIEMPIPYVPAVPAYLPYYGPYLTPEQIGYAQYPLEYNYASYEVIPHTIPEPQYDRYPTPASEVSPASSSSKNEEATAALSPPADKLSEDPEFIAFERNAMRAMALKNGGALLGNNPKMRRFVNSTSENAGDAAYKTQRQRNNVAAKQSRDRRKLREIQLALKVSYLSNKLAQLRAELDSGYCGNCRQPQVSKQ